MDVKPSSTICTEEDPVCGDDGGEPGIIIILNSDNEVHTALGLPAVAALKNPSLQQGPTPAVSKANFWIWLDTVLSNIGGPEILVHTTTNQRVEGFYHQLGQVQHSQIESTLDSYTAWIFECLANNISIGRYISIEGAGKGYCTMVHKEVGPFLT